MPDIHKTCSVFNAFNFRRDVHESIGHLVELTIGETTFEQDLELHDPEEDGKVTVVAPISSISWSGGFSEPVSINFFLSVTNKNEMATLLHTDMKSIEVVFSYDIFDYDPDARVWYKSFHSNDTALNGLLHVQGTQRDLYLDDHPGTEVEQPRNYGVNLGIVPEAEAQEIHLAVSQDKKFVKQWGVTRS
jgi:hypothetical protein